MYSNQINESILAQSIYLPLNFRDRCWILTGMASISLGALLGRQRTWDSTTSGLPQVGYVVAVRCDEKLQTWASRSNIPDNLPWRPSRLVRILDDVAVPPPPIGAPPHWIYCRRFFCLLPAPCQTLAPRCGAIGMLWRAWDARCGANFGDMVRGHLSLSS